MSLIKLNATDAIELMRKGELSSEKYVSAFLEHIEKREPLIGAWSFLDPELAIQQAKEADKRWKNKNAGKLNGLPIGIKDIIDTKGMPTENGSKICKNRKPSEDAYLVNLLKEAGAVIMGKCVTTEFALSGPGKTKNPNDLECTPGGSSSGSAAAVCDNMVPLSIGSQTGGSVLRPASFNGIIGLKPTFGTISRYGMSPISQRLDHPGIYATTINDIDLVASVLFSYDQNDLDMIKNFEYKNDVQTSPSPKFAFIKGPVWSYGEQDMQDEITNFVKNSPLNIVDFELDSIFENAAKSHEIIMNGSIARSLSKYYKNEKNKLHPFTISRIEAGMPVSAKDYIDAIENAKLMELSLKRVFKEFDAIITPSAPGQAPRDLMNTGNAIFNGYWTMMGVPAISLPLLRGKDNLPIGIQVITSWKEDSKLLKISEHILNKNKKRLAQ
ncbi:amidase [Alphaproteobacteria bacterium]|nr:amidase [Alphaproteobacteria bacterium]